MARGFQLTKDSYLAILSEREAIRWVLTNNKLAFTSAASHKEAKALKPMDEMFLYVTRGAWHNPKRHRGQIVGYASATSRQLQFAEPLWIQGRVFLTYVDIRVERLVGLHQGLDLQPLAKELEAFPKPLAWYTYLRRSLLPLTKADATTLRRLIPGYADAPASIYATYF
ncbi:hypothetical protein GA0070619_0287 [Micromonospora zamorensis]|nr:hypothetical protein GA0070619_0287 [Micromonospora zamorensis]